MPKKESAPIENPPEEPWQIKLGQLREQLEQTGTEQKQDTTSLPDGEESPPSAKEGPSIIERLRGLDQDYKRDVSIRKPKAFEVLHEIALLENDIYDAQKFLKELKQEGTYDPKSPAVKEAKNIISSYQVQIEELKKANPDVEELWLAPRREEHKKEMQRQQEAEQFRKTLEAQEKAREDILNHLNELFKNNKESIDFGHLRAALLQTMRAGIVEKYPLDDEKIKAIIANPKQFAGRFIRYGDAVYMMDNAVRKDKAARDIWEALQKLRKQAAENAKNSTNKSRK